MTAVYVARGAALAAGGRRLVRQLGPAGITALLVLALALVLELVHVPALQAHAVELETRSEAARLAAQRAARQAARAAQPAPTGAQFLAALPAPGEGPQRLEAVLTLATARGVAARQADVRSVADAALGTESLQVSLPLAGPYEAIRGFLEHALRADPTLTLDAVRLRRGGAEAPQWMAELRLSLPARARDAAVDAASTPASAAGSAR